MKDRKSSNHCRALAPGGVARDALPYHPHIKENA
jgi:hypothetical protein